MAGRPMGGALRPTRDPALLVPCLLAAFAFGPVEIRVAVVVACAVAAAGALLCTRRRDMALMAVALTPVGALGLSLPGFLLGIPALFPAGLPGRACGALAGLLLAAGSLGPGGAAAPFLGLAARAALAVLLADAAARYGRRHRGTVSMRALALTGTVLGLAEWWWRVR